MKERFLELLRETNRDGIEDLIKFLENSDFFKAPASTKFHGNYESGLLEHSLKVYDILENKVKNLDIELTINTNTLKIVALLHDICKTNFYMRKRNNGSRYPFSIRTALCHI